MSITRRALLLAPVLLAPKLAQATSGGRPLWPGARFTDQDRNKALMRGLRYIYASARRPKNFAEHGDDYLWCFYTLAVTTAHPELKQSAWRMGQERARQWRSDHRGVPADADADHIQALLAGSYSADCLGYPDEGMKTALPGAAKRFSAEDYLGFDPVKETVPADTPDICPGCEAMNARGVQRCRKCGTKLAMKSRYEVLCDALVASYFGERCGVRLGAGFADVTRRISDLQPYRGYDGGKNSEFVDVTYAVTHIVYTFNDYGAYRLRPEWLPNEFSFLKSNLTAMRRTNDPETLGEYLDTLKSFGFTEANSLIQEGTAFLLARQTADGSWGEAGDRDVYTRYHSTWTAITGLMNYAWRGEGLSFPDALPRARAT
jgi:hypothetical protein